MRVSTEIVFNAMYEVVNFYDSVIECAIMQDINELTACTAKLIKDHNSLNIIFQTMSVCAL